MKNSVKFAFVKACHRDVLNERKGIKKPFGGWLHAPELKGLLFCTAGYKGTQGGSCERSPTRVVLDRCKYQCNSDTSHKHTVGLV